MNLRANCVGLWKMNDNAANKTVVDSSGNDNDGEAQQNTEDLHTDGKINGALTFNGVDDYVDCGDKSDYDSTTKLSVMLWAKADIIVAAQRSFISKYKYSDSDDREWYLSVKRDATPVNLGYLRVTFGDPNNGTYESYRNTDNKVFSTESWHLIGFVYDGTLSAADRCKIYVDGVEKASSSSGLVPASLYNGTGKLVIGALDDGRGAFFDGKADAVMLFDKALSEEDVAFLWNDGNGREHLSIPRPLVDGSLASGRKGLI